MAIATSFEITFGCGHDGTLDLASMPADRRGGRLAYMKEKGMCGDCFVVTRDKRRELDRARWVTARQNEEAALAADWAVTNRFVPLTGSVKQIAFAQRVRYDLMRELYTWAVDEGHDPHGYEHGEDIARGVDASRWWLDQRELISQPGDLLELLDAAATTHEGQLCENTA